MIYNQLIDFDPDWKNSTISNYNEKRIKQELQLMNGFAGIQNMTTLVGYFNSLVYPFIEDIPRFNIHPMSRFISGKPRFGLFYPMTSPQLLAELLITIIHPT
jgi:hypothetical protein